MSVVGSDTITKDLDRKTFSAPPDYLAVILAVLGKSQEELPIMAPMG
jgi:hypothetical protein